MKEEKISKEVINEIIIKFRTVYVDFDNFVKGKEDVLLDNWYEIINSADLGISEPKGILQVINKICATKDSMPSLAEIIKIIEFSNCPF